MTQLNDQAADYPRVYVPPTDEPPGFWGYRPTLPGTWPEELKPAFGYLIRHKNAMPISLCREDLGIPWARSSLSALFATEAEVVAAGFVLREGVTNDKN